MPLLSKRKYTKSEPFRDATLVIVICEGSEKEPDYFDFFDRLTSQIKLVAVPSEAGKSSPNHLLPNAEKALLEHNSDEGDYELWFVIDVDKWLEKGHIQSLHKAIRGKQNWQIVISNPCFEVWLNNHFEKAEIEGNIEKCKTWKLYVHEKYGGFDNEKHPTLISKAIQISEDEYKEDGFVPLVGKTQVFRLGKRIYSLTKRVLDKYTD